MVFDDYEMSRPALAAQSRLCAEDLNAIAALQRERRAS
jgi:hypothetical protein